MTAAVRTIEPSVITTRERLHWTKTYADYPASLWQLNYYFRGQSSVGFTAAWGVEVTADGDTFDIVVAGSKTDDILVAGRYLWQAWLTEAADSSNKILIDQGFVRVQIGFDPASTAAVETRTPNEIALDTINAALLAFATSDILEYEVSTPTGTNKVKRSDKAQLMMMRDTYAKLVANERARERVRNGQPVMPSIKVRMTDA